MEINLSFQVIHSSLMSLVLNRMSCHLVEERNIFAESKSARSYLQIFLQLFLAVLHDFHFSDNSTPLWSDEPKGDNTVQEDIMHNLKS